MLILLTLGIGSEQDLLSARYLGFIRNSLVLAGTAAVLTVCAAIAVGFYQRSRPGAPSATAAYAARLRDPERAQAAADAWCQWETSIFGGDIHAPGSRYGDPLFRLGFARIVTHFFTHNGWFSDDQLLRQAARMAHIPCTMIHSRFDPSCPLRGPWELAQGWPAAALQILGGTTHSALDADMRAAIRAATDALPI